MKRVIDWFCRNQRSLPFRTDPKPYTIWVSEIMLQQTRIEAVIPYYERFIREVPDILTLAEMPEERLLKLWEGLGYYSRVRNMQKTAQLLKARGQAELPMNSAELEKLPGIGSYTAAAIASMAFHEQVPAVDGNVLRVFQRFQGSYDNVLLPETKKAVTAELKAYLEENGLDAGLFNQGMMELGETVCLPKGDIGCTSCPLQEDCRAYRKGLVQELPVREKPKQKTIQKKTVLIIKKGALTAVVKRTGRDVLYGLYGYPSLESHLDEEQIGALLKDNGFTVTDLWRLPDKKHVFTHRIWEMQAYLIRIGEDSEAGSLNEEPLIFADKETIEKTLALPRAFRKWEELP